MKCLEKFLNCFYDLIIDFFSEIREKYETHGSKGRSALCIQKYHIYAPEIMFKLLQKYMMLLLLNLHLLPLTTLLLPQRLN